MEKGACIFCAKKILACTKPLFERDLMNDKRDVGTSVNARHPDVTALLVNFHTKHNAALTGSLQHLDGEPWQCACSCENYP